MLVQVVLLQEDDNGVDHPVCYFSKKFNKHQKNNSTVKKECLSLILALQHFKVYVTSSSSHIVVFSDHNPLILSIRWKTRIRDCSDGACCYRNTILTSGISEEKIILFLMPCLEHDVLVCGFLLLAVYKIIITFISILFYDNFMAKESFIT